MRPRNKWLASAVFLFCAWAAAAPFLASNLIIQKDIGPADAMIVLSGSAAYKERTRHAADLYHQGIAPKIYITDDGERAAWSPTEQTNPPFMELERRELISRGVPAAAISVVPGRAAGTDDEAKLFRDHLLIDPVRSVVVVTSAYHSRRSLWTFENVLSGHDIRVGILPAPPSDRISVNFWWLTPQGWRAIGGEYVKWAAYYAYY